MAGTVTGFKYRATNCGYDDWSIQRLDCGYGVIDVIDSVCGCSKSWLCHEDGPSDRNLANTNWTQTNWTQKTPVDKFKTKCDGRKFCEVSLTGFHSCGTCIGAFKYLHTTFTCLQPMTVVACQGGIAHLDCGLGYVITINGAAYGRRDKTTCSEGKPFHQWRNIECSQPSTAMVAQMCKGKTTCSVPASNAVFTNPCQGIFKYLKISYTCKPPDSDDPRVL
ncbi:L-rhamnose-binding lectin CSL2-like [Hippocampus zosterae]|uniref:L-rhamnose-binding lectin CSL2-like n=1 Tax=Hippocampus zosterae TaxID=109293 RepID=UPI00223E5390|nr:L-rhamnose-binding lectin CSL2-like [Hippocampus zosterae]